MPFYACQGVEGDGCSSYRDSAHLVYVGLESDWVFWICLVACDMEAGMFYAEAKRMANDAYVERTMEIFDDEAKMTVNDVFLVRILVKYAFSVRI